MQYAIDKERIYLATPAPCIRLAVRLEGHVDAQRLADAARRAHSAHGLFRMRAVIGANGEAAFEPFEGGSLNATIYEREWSIGEAQPREFDIRAGEWLKCDIYAGEGGATLELCMHHLAGDGTALMCFASDIMEAYAGRDINPEAGAIKLFTPDMIPKNARLPLKIRLAAFGIRKQWKPMAFTQAQYEQMRENFWRDKRINAVYARFEPGELKALLENCRENGVTLTPAIAAAFALKLGGECATGVAVSLRPENWRGLGNFATGVTIKNTPASGDFWACARGAKALLDTELLNPGKKYFLINFMRAVPPTLIDAAYFSAYGGETNQMAKQAARMFGFTGDAEGVTLSNLSERFMEADYAGARAAGAILLPPPALNSRYTVGALTAGGYLTITMQCVNGGADEQALFESAIARLKEAARA